MNRRFPFSSFPNGWFRVAYSDELPPKKVMPLHYFGKDLVLLRTEDGTPHIFDAHCPHLGANLGYGGKVEGNTIRCPFHGWSFNCEGECVEIPYASKIPPKAQIRSWLVREVNGVIMVYYHAKGEPPTWEMPELSEWNPQEYTHFKRYSWKIRTHIQELVENGVDIAHLPILHKLGDVTSISVDKNNSSSFINTVGFRVGKQNQFFLRLFDRNCDVLMKPSWDGMGHNCNDVRVNISNIQINITSLFFPTPINTEYVELSLFFSIKKVFGKLITNFFHYRLFQDAIANMNQDIPVWENKAYRTMPLLCNNDGPIMQVRDWTEQFYDQESEIINASTNIYSVPEFDIPKQVSQMPFS